MRLTIRYKTVSEIYYALCMCFLTIYQFMAMRTMEHGIEAMPGTNGFTYLTLLVFVAAALKFYLIPGYQAYKPTRTMICAIAYSLWILVPIVLNDVEGKSTDQLNLVLRHLVPIFSLLLTYNFILNHGKRKWLGWYFAGSMLVFALQYFLIMMELFPSIAHMVVSYYTLFMLPLVLLTSGNKRKVVFLLFTLLVLISSIKRGGIVALAFGLAAYAFAYIVASEKVKMGAVIGGVIVMVVLGGVFFTMASSDENDLLERFENTENDEGSGRLVTWEKTYKLIEESNATSLIFGHGYNKVAQDSQMGWSAHNDFMEVTYDYGLVGLALYTAFFFSFMFMTFGHLRRKTPYAQALTMYGAIFLLLSMISHIIIYPWVNVTMLTISYIAGCDKYDAINQQNNI